MKKLLPAFVCLLFIVYLTGHLQAQCAAGASPFNISYDTLVTGNGNSSRTFSFPKFNPALGTLISIDIQSVVGLEYSYDLENQTAQTKVFKTKIVRTDDVYSTALDPSSIDAVNQTPQVSALIPAHTQLSYGPSKMSYSLGTTITDGRLINFMGAGTVDFDYETGTSASVQGPLPWQLNFTAVSDTTHFSLTYNYCTASLLSTDLLFFSATQLKGKVDLAWRQATVETGRIYHLQLSTDGQKYTSIANIAEDNIGNYHYTYLNNTSQKCYFRIEEINVSGVVKYSNIRVIMPGLASGAGIRIYPSLYTGGSLQVNMPYRADWEISCYSADGRRIIHSLQKDVYATQLELPAAISNGIYTAEVTNAATRQRMLTRIIVRR